MAEVESSMAPKSGVRPAEVHSEGCQGGRVAPSLARQWGGGERVGAVGARLLHGPQLARSHHTSHRASLSDWVDSGGQYWYTYGDEPRQPDTEETL